VRRLCVSPLPLERPLVVPRGADPAAARSSPAGDGGGTAPPCARATASSGVSTWASGVVRVVPVILDMLDYACGELRGRDLRGAGHLTGEIVRDAARPDRAGQPPHDRLRNVSPAETLVHHGHEHDHAPAVLIVRPPLLR